MDGPDDGQGQESAVGADGPRGGGPTSADGEAAGRIDTTDESADDEPDGPSEEESEGAPRTVAGVELTRRRGLAAGAVVIGGLGLGVASIWNEPRAPAPEVPEAALREEGWVQTEQERGVVSRQHYGPLTVTALGHTVRFADEGGLEAIRDRTAELTVDDRRFERTIGQAAPNAVAQPLALFAATRIDFGPDVDNAPLGIGRAEAMGSVRASARTQFARTLRKSGMENVRRTETGTFEVATGERARLDTFRAGFPIESVTVGGDTISLTVPAKTLEIAGYLAVWHHGDFAMVAAGGHPAENYDQRVTEDTDYGTATLTVDLGLDPAGYRETVRGFVREVQ